MSANVLTCRSFIFSEWQEMAGFCRKKRIKCGRGHRLRLPVASELNSFDDARSREVGKHGRVIGGRLQIADMVRDPSAEDSACCSREESWADCVSGALEPDTFLSMLTNVGFIDVELAGFTAYQTAASTTGALFKGIKPG
jgi:hypothetical protein